MSVETYYAITEAKKAELDTLTLQVNSTQDKVEQLQAVVTSLTEKKNNFSADFEASKTNLATALKNKNDLGDIINKANNLKANSNIACEEVIAANFKTKELAKKVRDVMLQVIYSAEIIDKLQNLIVRKKALNPLISDDLVAMVTKAGTDANNAVALMLVALNSTFTAQASIIEAAAAAGLEKSEATELYNSLIAPATKTSTTPVLGGTEVEILTYQEISNISNLINGAYSAAVTMSVSAQKGLDEVSGQLNRAQAQLMQSQIKLQSLEAGLAAANAAALAS